MRVLMVAPQPFFTPRGTPFSVLHRIRALLRLGHSVDLVTYPFGDSPQLPGLRIVRTARLPAIRKVGVGPSLAKLSLDIPLFLTARSLVRDGAYDLLHTHEEAGAMGAWLSGRYHLPHLYDMHSSLPQQFANFGRFNWSPIVATFTRMEQYTLDGADGVIAICPELHEHVRASGYRGALAMIENTLDFEVPAIAPEDVEHLRKTLGVDKSKVIVYTGTLEPYQGLELLIDAAQQVKERVPEARFVIVGGTSKQIEPLRTIARRRGVEPAFTFVAAVPPEKVFLYQRAADVLVTTRTRGTNTPLKIYQYLRAGKPIVATAIRSHTQVLDRTTAQLVPPTRDGVAEGIVEAMMNPERARSLAESAVRVARDRYGEEAYLTRLRDLLGQILANAWHLPAA